MEDLKGKSEGAFIQVVYNFLKNDSPKGLQSNKEYLEDLSRIALGLHKEYWRLMGGN